MGGAIKGGALGGMTMDVGESRANCSRCGTDMYDLRDRRSDVDGSYYCSRCAEELGKSFLTENMCYACNRSIGRSEVKFVLASRVFGARQLPVSGRVMCGSCYKRFATRSKSRVRFADRARARARAGFRNISRNFLVRNLQL